ncbi:ras-related protein Rab-39B [Contarinia nasturtii]|uniref:ras-related protein Rab-39B n=1 Tax=Contarinia nasturtii TaxID=265458 RepID=UPI0012D48A7C|nr:ras-related protein Rab-39B [Contarinia nasturtii]XP_031627800.1 ras-related protein Rab-39B [Contarinia nasturtii]
MVEPIFDYQFRLILIGDSTVGKSSLLKYFTDGRFAELSDPTVGVDFFARIIEVKDGTRIKLQLWDTAGQERFRSITKSYYRNSVGVLLVYDITNHASFEHIPLWMMEAKRHIEPHRPVFALTGCKLDLVSNGARREVSRDEAKAFAEQNGLFFVETSARTGVNVEEVFNMVTNEVYARIQSGEYKIEEGWDGIKPSALFGRPNSLDFNLVVAEPEKSTCC